MPRSSSHSHRKSSRSYSRDRDRDRDYKKRSSSDEDYYERKRLHRRSRSPSSSSRSKLSYKSARRYSNSSSDNDHRKKSKSSKSRKDKKSKKSNKRSYRSPSSSSKSSVESAKSIKSRNRTKSSSPEIVIETKPNFDLNLLEGKINPDILDDIDSDRFQSKNFTSSSSNKQSSQKVYIDLEKDIITVPASDMAPLVNDSIMHPNFLGDETEKTEKWIKKVYNFRQRLLQNT